MYMMYQRFGTKKPKLRNLSGLLHVLSLGLRTDLDCRRPRRGGFGWRRAEPTGPSHRVRVARRTALATAGADVGRRARRSRPWRDESRVADIASDFAGGVPEPRSVADIQTF